MDISRTTYKERNFTDYTKRTLPDHSVCSTKFSTFFISLIQNLIHFTCQKVLKKTKRQFSRTFHRNLRTFQGKMEFKDFLRTSRKIQGLLNSRLREHCKISGAPLVISAGRCENEGSEMVSVLRY